MPNHALLRIFAAAAALTAYAVVARADLMAACASEVSRYCADVDHGRGRVTACLASHLDKLGSGCLPEVQAVARSRLVPGDVRKIFDPAFHADLPRTCEADAARFCSGVMTGDGRIFACLYARASRVGRACSSAARATLKQAN